MINEDMLTRILQALERKKLKKAEASRAAGFSPTFLRDLFPEGDQPPRKRSLTYENLKALADVLETTPEWLAEGRGPMTADAGGELVSIMPRLDQRRRAEVTQYARFLAEQAKRESGKE